MESEKIIYKGIILTVLFSISFGEKPELDSGFKGTCGWKTLEAVAVGGVDITRLLEEHFEAIENKLNHEIN